MGNIIPIVEQENSLKRNKIFGFDSFYSPELHRINRVLILLI